MVAGEGGKMAFVQNPKDPLLPFRGNRLLAWIMAVALPFALLAVGVGFGRITIGFALILAIAIAVAPIMWLRRHGRGAHPAAAAHEHPHTQPPALDVPIIHRLPDPPLRTEERRVGK